MPVLGAGVWSIKDTFKEGSLALIIPDDAIERGIPCSNPAVNFTSHIVSSYSELRKELGINANITATAHNIGSVSAKLNFLKSVTLTQTDAFIVVRAQVDDHIDRLRPGKFQATEDARSLLTEDDKVTFLHSYGDRYINVITYGKELIALVRFKNVTDKTARVLKASLDSKLNIPSSVGEVSAGLSIEHGTHKEFKDIDVEMSIHCVGVSIEAPKKTDSIEALIDVMASFADSQKSKFVPIGYATQAYSTVIRIRAVVELERAVESAKLLLDGVERTAYRILFILHTITAVNGAEGRYDEQEIKRLQLEGTIQKLLTLQHQIQWLGHNIEMTIPNWKTETNAVFREEHAQIETQVLSQEDVLNKIYALRVMVGQACSDPQDRKPDLGHHAHSSDRFTLGKGARYCIWHVAKTPHAKEIIFDVSYKDRNHHYHLLFKNIRGQGHITELPSNFPSDNLGCVIHNPRNTEGLPFNVVISEKEEVDQRDGGVTPTV